MSPPPDLRQENHLLIGAVKAYIYIYIYIYIYTGLFKMIVGVLTTCNT